MQERKVFFVRHGQTAWSIAGKHTGKTDIPLTPQGIQEAKLLQPLLESHAFTQAFVSPLQRAMQTFETLQLPVLHTIDIDLMEWDYGSYEGKTSKEIRQTRPHWSLFDEGAPEGESPQDVAIRAQRMCEKISDCKGQVLIVSSAHFLRALAVTWLRMPISSGKHLCLSTASLSILGYEHSNPALLSWNVNPFPVTK